MKLHYINILIFALPLNILVYIQRNHKSITHHAINENPIKTHRSLCKCDLFAAQNYDNDHEMQSVMHDFDRQTLKRFREYDERMIKSRQKCKEQCDKDIQKIILKDKIEKELTEKLNALQTDINTEDIPACVCKKSLADKMEKKCLKCTQNLGGVVAPSSGVLGGIAELGLSAWKTTAIDAAIAAAKEAAIAKGLAAGTQEGIKAVISGLETELSVSTLFGRSLKTFFSGQNYTDIPNITQAVYIEYQTSCVFPGAVGDKPICTTVTHLGLSPGTGQLQGSTHEFIGAIVKKVVTAAETSAATETTKVTNTQTVILEARKIAAVDTICASCHTSIIASIVAILVIVLVMMIIYLILRYLRKNKMKKKLQYIKLLNE
ncbi:PIR protein, putative [Plasmodium sp. gorilla clade G1]|nr:PIR protein, putative [Plasmodium sp. gorilla clade G1]